MEKLGIILCELTEKLDALLQQLSRGTGEEIQTSLFVISKSGTDPLRLTGRNSGRVEVWLHNASDHNLYLAPTADGDIGPERYSLSITPGDTLVLNSHKYAHLYKRDIYGFWDPQASSDSKAMITEFSRIS